MESIKSVLEVIWMDNIYVKLHLTSHCPSCKTQTHEAFTPYRRIYKFVNETVALISKLLSKSNKKKTKNLLTAENGC